MFLLDGLMTQNGPKLQISFRGVPFSFSGACRGRKPGNVSRIPHLVGDLPRLRPVNHLALVSQIMLATILGTGDGCTPLQPLGSGWWKVLRWGGQKFLRLFELFGHRTAETHRVGALAPLQLSNFLLEVSWTISLWKTAT